MLSHTQWLFRTSAFVCVLLIAVILFGWRDAYHMALGLPVLAFVVLACAVVFHTCGERDSLDEQPDEGPTQIPGFIVQGGLLAGVTCALLWLVFAVGQPAKGFFEPSDNLPRDLIERLDAFEEVKAYEQAVAAIDQHMAEHNPTAAQQNELADRKVHDLIEWAKTMPLCDGADHAMDALHQAVDTAGRFGLDPALANSELGRVKATCGKVSLPAANLPLGCEGAIRGVDASQYPPAVAVYLSLECPSAGGGALEPYTGLADKDIHATAGGQDADVWLGGLPGGRDPTRAALVIDSSGSMQGEPLARAKEGAHALLATLSPADEVSVFAFSDAVTQIQDWTRGPAAAGGAVDGLQAGGGTALYDAAWQALESVRSAIGSQRVVVLLSDGADTGSMHSLDEVVQAGKAAGVPLFVIGLSASSDYDRPTLARLATETGGLLLETTSPTDLEALFVQIAGQIRQVYRVMIRIPAWEQPVIDVALTIGGENAVELTRRVQRGAGVSTDAGVTQHDALRP